MPGATNVYKKEKKPKKPLNISQKICKKPWKYDLLLKKK